MFASQHLSVAALCLALFSLPTSLAQTTTIVMVSVTTTSTATATVTTTPAPAPTIDPGVGDYNYMGCYNETSNDPNAGNIRALDANSTASNAETVAVCITQCDRLQYGWAGLEYGRECYCGPNLNSNAEKLDDSRCNIPCSGDDSQVCGGNLALTVYRRNPSSSSTSGAVSLSHRINTIFGLVLGSLLAFGGLGLVVL